MTEFRYVRHADIPKWEAQGWIVVDDFSGCHHGEYAVLMGKA